MQKQIASSGEIGDLRDAALAEASLCRLRNCFKNAGDAEAVQAADIGLFRYRPPSGPVTPHEARQGCEDSPNEFDADL